MIYIFIHCNTALSSKKEKKIFIRLNFPESHHLAGFRQLNEQNGIPFYIYYIARDDVKAFTQYLDYYYILIISIVSLVCNVSLTEKKNFAKKRKY